LSLTTVRPEPAAACASRALPDRRLKSDDVTETLQPDVRLLIADRLGISNRPRAGRLVRPLDLVELAGGPSAQADD
jgi:hypothetical protein